MANVHPTAWQKKILWAAISAVSLLTIGAISIYLIWLAAKVMAFLQPLLIPVAIAAVLAFLLEPVVRFLCTKGMSRLMAVISVFLIVTLSVGSIVVWVGPAIYGQSEKLLRRLPGYVVTAHTQVSEWAEKYNFTIPQFFPPAENGKTKETSDVASPAPSHSSAEKVSPEEGASSLLPPVDLVLPFQKPEELAETDLESKVLTDLSASPVPEATQTPSIFSPDAFENEEDSDVPTDAATFYEPYIQELVTWIQLQLPNLLQNLFQFVKRSVGGFLGIFGSILSLILVPVYLFFFLKDSPHISQNWAKYVPLRSSIFRDEVVETLTEINGYLINFFRGQLLVSLINGALTGIILFIIGLDFALLIGLLVGILGLIPYIGVTICLIPAVLIAMVQWPGEWFHPLLVAGVFFGVQQFEGIVISPKIVGSSVGLHPLTIIISMFAWSLLLGGLLGAILAVPLTATLKVLLTRYVWHKALSRSAAYQEADSAASEPSSEDPQNADSNLPTSPQIPPTEPTTNQKTDSL